MPLTLEQLTTPLTREEVQSSIYTTLGTLGVNTTQWGSGSVVRTMIVGTSIVLSAFSQLTAAIARSGFVQYAAGDWLDVNAQHTYGVTRIEATFATGNLRLTNGGGGVYNMAPGDLIVKNTVTLKEYRNTTSFTLNAGAILTVPISAIESGSASSASANQITSFTTPLLGVVCTNLFPIAGLDGENDASLRQRALAKLGALSPNGPWDAYTYAAYTAVRSDGAPAAVNRTKITKDGFGNVTVTVAGVNGVVTGTLGDLATDLGAVDDAIQRNAVPLAVTCTVQSATTLAVAVNYSAWAYNTSGKSATEIQAAILAALQKYIAGQPIGGNVIAPAAGKIFVEVVRGVILEALPEIFHVTTSAPAVDVTFTANQVAVLGTVTCSALTLSAPPEGFGGVG